MLETIRAVDWTSLCVWAGVICLCVVGFAGTVVPGLPGTPLIFAAAFLIAWYGDYEVIGVFKLIVLGVMAAIGVCVDWIAQMLGAKKAGASRYGIAGALIGTIAGLFFGIVGLIFFPLVGAVVGEMIANRKIREASGIGIATWLGMLVGAAVKIAVTIAMIAILVISYV